MSFFKKVNPNVPKDRQDSIVDPVLYSDQFSELYVVTDVYNKNQANFIKNAIRRVYGDYVPFTLLYCYTFRPSDKDIKKDMSSFVYKYGTDYTKYIPPKSKVLAIGRSIYTFTMETYLTAPAFYSYKYLPTNFYHPGTQSWIFPVDELFKIFSFDEKRVLDNFENFFFNKQIEMIKNFKIPALRIPKLEYIIVENPNEFLSQYIGQEMEVAWDLETNGLIYYKNKIVCITISFDGRTGYYLDFNKVDLKILNEFFKGKYQIGANLKFDCKFLRNLGVENAKIDFDTLNAGHCINETAPNSLGAHGWMYTYYGGHEIELHRYKKTHPKLKDYSQIPRSILSKYAAFDAIIDFQTYKKQMEFLAEDPQLFHYYFTEVIPNLNMFLELELEGVVIDWDYLEELKKQFEEKKKSLENEIFKLLGFKVNLASNKDLAIALEQKAKLPDLGMRSKEGLYLTNEEAMTSWSKLGYEVASKILEYKSTCNQINTFIGSEKDDNAYWKFRNDPYGTVHPTYSVMLALSHRNKCQAPNLQQVPKRTSTAELFRRIFVPPTKNYFMAEGDYAAYQMRIAAILSGDQNLKDAFTKYGGDVHSMTAVAIFHPDWSLSEFMKVKKESPYKEERGLAKGTNFAFLFGGSAWSFAEDVLKKEWSKEQCLKFLEDMNVGFHYDDDLYHVAGEFIRNSYFTKYPKLKEWHDKQHAEARETGMVRCAHGARRLLPRMLYIGKDTDKKIISDDQNISKNSPVQNFESVAIMRSMREFRQQAKENEWRSRIFGMIHDAVEFYIDKEERSFMVSRILEIFQKDYEDFDGVHMAFELELSDTSLGEVWGFGNEVAS